MTDQDTPQSRLLPKTKAEHLEEEFFQHRWDHAPVTHRSWTVHRIEEIRREAAEELRTLLHEVLVGMRNSPVRRARAMLVAHGFEFPPDEHLSFHAIRGQRDDAREDLKEALTLLKVSDLTEDNQRETLVNGAFASYDQRREELLAKHKEDRP